MNTLNQMKLSFLSRSANEGFARVAVAAFFAQLDPTVDEIADIKTAGFRSSNQLHRSRICRKDRRSLYPSQNIKGQHHQCQNQGSGTRN